MLYQLQDFKTKEIVSPTNMVFTGEHGPWEVTVDLDRVRSSINPDYFRQSPPYNSKYLPFMPVKDYSSFVSLKEGATPLLPSKVIGKEKETKLYLKLESQNPTGSFKDRGSAVDLSVARELGAKGIAVASTGNMAASCSCYAAAAGLPCFVFVPEGTPASKLSQVIAFGGRIVQVKGDYNAAARLSEEVAAQFDFFLAGDYAFRIEGQKTAAFEVCEQLFFHAPDAVIVPIGCGTNIAAYKKGFQEFFELGLIEKMPQLIGVQAEGASSVVNSFRTGSRSIEPLAGTDTIASAIRVANPLDGIKALDAIYSTEGRALAVSDREMIEAQYLLSTKESQFVEAACAASVAGFMKLQEMGSFQGQTVVCVLTGDGLKDPASILKAAIKPPTIYPEIGAFQKLYDNRFFEGRSVSFMDHSTVMFREEPSAEEVRTELMKHFDTNLGDSSVQHIREFVAKFLQKGKVVSFSDFQDIVQDALESLQSDAPQVFEVKHFEVNAAMDRQSTAKVSVRIDEEEFQTEGSGVGPVDAIISALRAAAGERMEFALVDYRVEIRDKGTDAVVFVELSLRKDNFVSVGGGASPDIIQASIEAFEGAYNGFHGPEGAQVVNGAAKGGSVQQLSV